jgi:hypothetical protein
VLSCGSLASLLRRDAQVRLGSLREHTLYDCWFPLVAPDPRAISGMLRKLGQALPDVPKDLSQPLQVLTERLPAKFSRCRASVRVSYVRNHAALTILGP